MEKKGQFYLIAAIILATIVIGITAVSNYSSKQDPAKLDDLKEEIQIESSNVLDYGISNTLNDVQIKQLLTDFSSDYINSNKNKNLYFIFGGTSEVTIVAWQKNPETAIFNSGSGNEELEISQEEIFSDDFSVTGNAFVLNIDEIENSFELNEGENFYFLISQDIKGEKYVVRN